MPKSIKEIETLPSHKRKRELKKRRLFRIAEAKRTLSSRIRAEDDRKKKVQEENKK